MALNPLKGKKVFSIFRLQKTNNIASGGSETPPIVRFCRDENRQILFIRFPDLVIRILLAKFFKKDRGSYGPKELSRYLFSRVSKRNFYSISLRVFHIFL